MILRDFLYLDRRLVTDFLAQLEGGSIDQMTERQTTTGKGLIGARIGVSAVGLNGEKSSERSLETEAVVKQVAASEFDRLYSFLEDDSLLVLDDVSDMHQLDDVRRKAVVEADARIRVSGLQQVLALMNTFISLAPLAGQLGAETTLDDSNARAIGAFAALGATGSKLPVIATVSGSVNLEIALELDPASSIVSEWDLDASVVFKVQRVLKPGEKYLVGDPLGGVLKLMPEKDRTALMDSLVSPDAAQIGISGNSEISYPGVVATPIAIYR